MKTLQSKSFARWAGVLALTGKRAKTAGAKDAAAASPFWR